MKRSKLPVALLLCIQLRAQIQSPSGIAQEIVDKALANAEFSAFAGTVQPDPITGASAMDGLIATWMLDRHGGHEELLHWMEYRSELQVGAHPGLGGSSSAILKALPPGVLGMATDMGLMTRSNSGTLVTFRATPTGVARALLGWNSMVGPLDRLSVSATFDQNSPNSGGQRMISWSAGIELYNARRPRASQLHALMNVGAQYVLAREALVSALSQWPEFRQWQARFADRLELDADRPLARHWIEADYASAIALRIATEELAALSRLPLPAPVMEALSQYAGQLRQQLLRRDRTRQLPRTGPILSADWTVLRPPGQQARWAATAIASTTLGRSARADLTANWTIQSSGGAHGALDLTLPMRAGLGSLTARYGRAQWNSGTADVRLQATWSIRLATGIRLPLAVGLSHGRFTGSASPQITAGIQLATDALLDQLRQK